MLEPKACKHELSQSNHSNTSLTASVGALVGCAMKVEVKYSEMIVRNNGLQTHIEKSINSLHTTSLTTSVGASVGALVGCGVGVLVGAGDGGFEGLGVGDVEG